MRGDLVIVRDCERKPLIRRVWDESEEMLCIRAEEEYQKALAGEPALAPVGFHLTDVFEYDPENIENAARGDWSGLKPRATSQAQD